MFPARAYLMALTRRVATRDLRSPSPTPSTSSPENHITICFSLKIYLGATLLLFSECVYGSHSVHLQ